MRSKNESGFSLIELLLVVVIVGVVAAVAVPAYRKGISAAEKGVTNANLRTISSTQVSFFSQNSRFGRLDEINRMLSGALGVLSGGGNQLYRNNYTFEMVGAGGVPTDAELRTGYAVIATRNANPGDLIYQFQITQDGVIQQIQP